MAWSERLMRERNREVAPLDAVQLTERQVAWLDELLRDARASHRTSPWELNFIDDVAVRFSQYRERTRITEPQMAVLRRIEGKIHACG